MIRNKRGASHLVTPHYASPQSKQTFRRGGSSPAFSSRDPSIWSKQILAQASDALAYVHRRSNHSSHTRTIRLWDQFGLFPLNLLTKSCIHDPISKSSHRVLLPNSCAGAATSSSASSANGIKSLEYWEHWAVVPCPLNFHRDQKNISPARSPNTPIGTPTARPILRPILRPFDWESEGWSPEEPAGASVAGPRPQTNPAFAPTRVTYRASWLTTNTPPDCKSPKDLQRNGWY